MRLDLTRYRHALDHVSKTFDAGEVDRPDEAYRVVASVELEFDIHKDKARFRLVGRTATVLELPCSRCVEPFRMPVAAGFDLRYVPVEEMTTEDDREVRDDDLETSYYRDDEIDLAELMREQFYLALPMKPLCGDGCKGLCGQCGTNLNVETCACAPAWEDPRLAPLKTLSKRVQ